MPLPEQPAWTSRSKPPKEFSIASGFSLVVEQSIKTNRLLCCSHLAEWFKPIPFPGQRPGELHCRCFRRRTLVALQFPALTRNRAMGSALRSGVNFPQGQGFQEPSNLHEVDGLRSKEKTMRKMIFCAAAAAFLVNAWAAVSPAEAQEFKYCLQSRQWGYPGNCQFSSYRQCLASASGTNASCGINPRYAYGSQRRHR
jgi:hypothetical protein